MNTEYKYLSEMEIMICGNRFTKKGLSGPLAIILS